MDLKLSMIQEMINTFLISKRAGVTHTHIEDTLITITKAIEILEEIKDDIRQAK